MKKIILTALLSTAISTTFAATTSTKEYMPPEEARKLLDELSTVSGYEYTDPLHPFCQRLNKHSQTGLETLSDKEIEEYYTRLKGKQGRDLTTLEKIRRDRSFFEEVKQELVRRKNDKTGEACEYNYFYYQFIFIQLPNVAPDLVTEDLLAFLLAQLIEESESPAVVYATPEINKSRYKELFKCARYIAQNLPKESPASERLAFHLLETLPRVSKEMICDYIGNITFLLIDKPALTEVFAPLIPFLRETLLIDDFGIFLYSEEILAFASPDMRLEEIKKHAIRTHCSTLSLLRKLGAPEAHELITVFCKKHPEIASALQQKPTECSGK